MIDRKNIKVGDELDFRFKVREISMTGTIWMDNPFSACSYLGWAVENNYSCENKSTKPVNLIAHHPAPEPPLKAGDRVNLTYANQAYHGTILAISPDGRKAWVEVPGFNCPLTRPIEELWRVK